MTEPIPPAAPIVLLVEDNPRTGQLFEHMLREAGYRVRVVRTAEAALEETPALRPAAIVLDLGLPNASGEECLRRLRAQSAGSDVPVAIVTGNYMLDDGTIDELKGLGARIHFKPIWEEDLRRIVDELVHHDRG